MNYKDHLELLYIEEDGKGHYVYIKDFNRLMFTFSKYEGRKHFCVHCLHCFSSDDLLEKHLCDCLLINGTQAIEMPPKDSKVYFKNYQKILPVPFVIYADFEAITEKNLSLSTLYKYLAESQSLQLWI